MAKQRASHFAREIEPAPKRVEPVTVRSGKYGPFSFDAITVSAQIATVSKFFSADELSSAGLLVGGANSAWRYMFIAVIIECNIAEIVDKPTKQHRRAQAPDGHRFSVVRYGKNALTFCTLPGKYTCH